MVFLPKIWHYLSKAVFTVFVAFLLSLGGSIVSCSFDGVLHGSFHQGFGLLDIFTPKMVYAAEVDNYYYFVVSNEQSSQSWTVFVDPSPVEYAVKDTGFPLDYTHDAYPFEIASSIATSSSVRQIQTLVATAAPASGFGVRLTDSGFRFDKINTMVLTFVDRIGSDVWEAGTTTAYYANTSFLSLVINLDNDFYFYIDDAAYPVFTFSDGVPALSSTAEQFGFTLSVYRSGYSSIPDLDLPDIPDPFYPPRSYNLYDNVDSFIGTFGFTNYPSDGVFDYTFTGEMLSDLGTEQVRWAILLDNVFLNREITGNYLPPIYYTLAYMYEGLSYMNDNLIMGLTLLNNDLNDLLAAIGNINASPGGTVNIDTSGIITAISDFQMQNGDDFETLFAVLDDIETGSEYDYRSRLDVIIGLLGYSALTEDDVEDEDESISDLAVVASQLKDEMSGKFPFCIVFEVGAISALLVAEPELPSFDLPIPSVSGGVDTFTISVPSEFSPLFAIIRWGVLLMVVFGLVMLTPRFFGGKEDD